MPQRLASMALGLLCICGTIAMLFGHIKSLDDITQTHLVIALALVVTTGAGHFAIEATATSDRLLFWPIFAVGMFLCVGLSSGRTAAILQRDSTQKADTDTAYQDQLKSLDEKRKSSALERDSALKQNEEALRNVTDACKSGNGSACKGANAIQQARQQALEQRTIDAKEADDVYWNTRKKHTPTRSTSQDFHNFVTMYAKLRGITEAEAEPVVLTLLPYLFTMLMELGAIVFTMKGLRPHTSKPSNKQPDLPLATTIPLAHIAKELNITPAQARASMRAMRIKRPPHGWSFTPDEAQSIKSRLSTLH